MNCPKCRAETRDVARFCPRCHATLRYQCPSCGHEQRHGGECEKCGVNFLKYITSVVAAKQVETDILHEKIERRSTFMKNLLLAPFNLGIPLFKSLILGSKRRRGA